MNIEALMKKYRAHFSRALILTVAVAGIIEVLAYVIFVGLGHCALSLKDSYLWNNVILPIGLNCLICFVAVTANKAQKVTEDYKDEAIIYGASAIAFVISIAHREFVVNTGACLFPLILSATFNDKKLISRTFLLSLLTIVVTVICSVLDGSMNLSYQINYLVMFGFLGISYIACSLSVQYSQLYMRLIKQQARDNAQLQDIVLQDSMTGLYNHRTFHVELQTAIDRNLRDDTALCLAMIDIDHFKQINDRHGHESGDEVLHKLATVLKQFRQPEDKAFRYGGEEFAVIFSGKTLEESVLLLHKMHEAFSNAEYAFTDETITFSAGVASYCKGESKVAFFDRADDLLYTAKEKGRNQIRVEEKAAI